MEPAVFRYSPEGTLVAAAQWPICTTACCSPVVWSHTPLNAPSEWWWTAEKIKIGAWLFLTNTLSTIKSINQSNPVLLKEWVRIPRKRRARGAAMLWGALPFDGVGSCQLFFTDDLHDTLSWVPASDKPHTFKSKMSSFWLLRMSGFNKSLYHHLSLNLTYVIIFSITINNSSEVSWVLCYMDRICVKKIGPSRQIPVHSSRWTPDPWI